MNSLFEQKGRPFSKKRYLEGVVLLVLLLVFVSALIYAITSTTTTFYDGTTNKNITFTDDNKDITTYIDIPLYVYVHNATMIVEGFIET